MKRAGYYWLLVTLGGGLLIGGCSKHQSAHSSLDTETIAQLKRFVAEKQAQVEASTNDAVPGFAPFFAAAKTGDWRAVSNIFNSFRNDAGQLGTEWQPVIEVWGAFDAFAAGDAKYSAAFGRDIIASIPPGSIYFGGTDPGRFIVTAMCRSQVAADPFFVLTQDALVDKTYLDYLRQMYGDKIYLPNYADASRCFNEYTNDLQMRARKNQLKPGEKFHLDAHGRIQISGRVCVMEINGRLAKTIFDKNPQPEFYLEESSSLDWMYPQLEPHGLIFKLDRQPMTTLSDDLVQSDHDYWAKYIQPMIGDWLHDDTPIADVAAFADKIFGRRDFSGFNGDRRFIRNAYARKMFSKLRSSIAGLYAWRVNHAADAADKEHMAKAADLAFRQAWALCPYSPEAVFRYVNFLMEQERVADALLVAQTAAKLPAMAGRDRAEFRSLVERIETYHEQK